MENDRLNRTLSLVAEFYDSCKFGCEGCEGYRKSTDLAKFIACMQHLTTCGLIDPDRTSFADLGCADGRVNVLASFFVRQSIGIEIDQEILDEYEPRKHEVSRRIAELDLLQPPDNTSLFHGSSLEPETFSRIEKKTGLAFDTIDVFYTYITLHDLFAEKITSEAKSGALYLVYGFHKVLPRYEGLETIMPDVASQGIAALYRK